MHAQEPPTISHPYFMLSDEARKRFLVSLHMGGRTLESHWPMFPLAFENVRDYLVERRPLLCVVNKAFFDKEAKK